MARLVRQDLRDYPPKGLLFRCGIGVVTWYGVAYLTQAVFFALLTQSSIVIVGAMWLFLMRISSGIIIPLDTSLLQVNTAPELRGRVFALHGSTYGGVMQLSYVLSGFAYGRFGVPNVGVFIGLISLVCGVSWLWQFGMRHTSVAPLQ